MTSEERAIRLRDAALQIVQRGGSWESCGSDMICCWTHQTGEVGPHSETPSAYIYRKIRSNFCSHSATAKTIQIRKCGARVGSTL
jgi:hypothetical protein